MKKFIILGLIASWVFACCSSEDHIDLKQMLTSKRWTLEQYKLPTQQNFETFAFKNIYLFESDGTCIIKKPVTRRISPFKIDTTFKKISWTIDLKQETINLIGQDTLIGGADTLIYEINDWRIVEIQTMLLKVNNLNEDGLPTNYMFILKGN